MAEKRQPLQVSVIVYRNTPEEGLLVLALLRSEKWGGFWQPVTGGVLWGEDIKGAALREVREETGITGPLHFFDMDYQYTFILPDKYKEFYDDDVRILTEHAFGYETNVDNVVLCDEHTEYLWLPPPEVFKLFENPEYREAVRRVIRYLDKSG